MKPTTLKRIQLIGAIILFMGAFVVPRMTCGTTIYVDDDNTSGPWNGTVEHPYQHIQDGINNSVSADTVFVFNGAYNESLTVDKTISLKGENKNSTVIDGRGRSGSIITVSADSVNISGFTVEDSVSNTYKIAGIHLSSSYNTIFDNNIKVKQSYGIVIASSDSYSSRP